MLFRSNYWYAAKAAHLGGKRRMELHGPLGTFESRREGGLKTIALFRRHPAWARRIGWQMRKRITRPKPSALLAEFIGVMLGDGGVRNSWQIAISFNGRDDRPYANWICQLVQRLFSLTPTHLIRERLGAADLIVSSTELVDFLVQFGVPRGHKLKRRLTIPRCVSGIEDGRVFTATQRA